jgi:hypothetical protein
MRTIHKAVKEVTLAISTSPWSQLAVNATGTVSSSAASSVNGNIRVPIGPSLSVQPSTTVNTSINSGNPPSFPSARGATTMPGFMVASNGNGTAPVPNPINTAIATSLYPGPPTASYGGVISPNPSATAGLLSGYVTPVPATPLSAALGPAVQAAMSSTPIGLGPSEGTIRGPTIAGGGAIGLQGGAHPMLYPQHTGGSTTGERANTNIVFERAERLLRDPQRRV